MEAGVEENRWQEGMAPEEVNRHIRFMKEAMKQAKKAYALGEVPIGCVIVHEGKVIGRGYNRRNTDKNTLSHSSGTGGWRNVCCT